MQRWTSIARLGAPRKAARTALFAAIVIAAGCHKQAPDADSASASDDARTDAVIDTSTAAATSASSTSPSAASSANAATTATASDKPYDGPLLGAMAFQTPIYPETRFGDERLGYIRQGGKVPVDPKPIHKPNCKEGWYHLLDGGYVCGKYATLDLENPRVKLGVKAPDTSAVLPYQYAYNRFHGTPLYRELPTREEMYKYEPYLLDDKKKKEAKDTTSSDPGEKGDASASASANASASATPDDEHKSAKHAAPDTKDAPVVDDKTARAEVEAMNAIDAPPDASSEDEPPAPKPWWQQKDGKPTVTLADLSADADGNLDKRMVKGFFVAVDKTFGWNSRTWYRTTNGLLAPTDRMWIVKPPESKGIELPDDAKGAGFVLGDKADKFELSSDGKKMKDKGHVARFTGEPLTGKTVDVDGATYRETTDGWWMKDNQITTTAPGARPSDIGADEKWVDVTLEKKTLVLFVGDKMVYAALISPGKHSTDKKKDHRTPTGSWRIREKHIAVMMHGEGAAGDLPYDIDDVPYVSYFKGSYALHGAFWHSNFGHDMSHGCVNLSPLDAKYVFNWVEPALPRGWHAVWATKDHLGTTVVIHD